MKFFFPDSQDLIDPSFDFETEARRPERVRQRTELYAHEVFAEPICDGLLLSKGIVDGSDSAPSRYTLAQRCRLTRSGARDFLHLGASALPVMGDCGAYTYLDDLRPPGSVEELVEFYRECRVDFGLSLDHVILAYQPEWDTNPGQVPSELRRRQDLTLELAESFLEASRTARASYEPIGVAQGWSPDSYVRSARHLQELGYRYIAIGGMAAARPGALVGLTARVADSLEEGCRLHLLGVRTLNSTTEFRALGVTSFDTTSPLRQAFKDDLHNYHTTSHHYAALRVDPVESPRVARLVTSGQLQLQRARVLESACLEHLVRFERGNCSAEDVLGVLLEYEQALTGPSGDGERLALYERLYRKTLGDAPWRQCPCEVCRVLGHHVILLRGSERSRRRGFHNLWVFYRQHQESMSVPAPVPSSSRRRTMAEPRTLSLHCLEVAQTPGRRLLVFGVDGKMVPSFAAVSRAHRDASALIGYQRGEVRSHIEDIRRYLDSPDPLIPNALVVAFDSSVRFVSSEPALDGPVRAGRIEIPVRDEADEQMKAGFVVDGQQRLAAIRESNLESFPVLVAAFITDDKAYQAQQFILVNSTKPLPKGLLFELLPYAGGTIPAALEKRRLAASITEALNQREGSPFFGLIQTPTCPSGIVKDLSILKMLENSLRDGILYAHRSADGATGDVEAILGILEAFWGAVSEVFHDAWGLPPKQSRLLHGAGVVSMGFIMDAIGDRNRTAGPLTRSVFVRDLAPLREVCRWTSGYWNFGQHDQRRWNDVQNTHQDVRALTRHLLGHYKRLVWAPEEPQGDGPTRRTGRQGER